MRRSPDRAVYTEDRYHERPRFAEIIPTAAA